MSPSHDLTGASRRCSSCRSDGIRDRDCSLSQECVARSQKPDWLPVWLQKSDPAAILWQEYKVHAQSSLTFTSPYVDSSSHDVPSSHAVTPADSSRALGSADRGHLNVDVQTPRERA